MRYLVEACEIQLTLQGTGREILVPAPEICERAAQQMEAFQKLSDADESAGLSAHRRAAGRGIRAIGVLRNRSGSRGGASAGHDSTI